MRSALLEQGICEVSTAGAGIHEVSTAGAGDT